MRIKIRASDSIFSKFIRTRAGWKCERCLTQHEENSGGLHNSHFWGRGTEAVRFDPENCDALCYGCHRYFGSNPVLYSDWKLKKLGADRFNALMVRAKSMRKKRDDKLDLIVARKLLASVT